jgi:hypothetical protein
LSVASSVRYLKLTSLFEDLLAVVSRSLLNIRIMVFLLRINKQKRKLFNLFSIKFSEKLGKLLPFFEKTQVIF